MKLKSILPYLLVIAIVAGVFGLVKRTGQNSNLQEVKPDKLRVQASWLLNGEFANVCSAIVNGYYKDNNLDVELIPGGPSGASFIVATTAIAQDPTLDIGIDGDLVPLLRGVAKSNPNEKLNVKAFASFWDDNPYGFMVRADSGIKSIKDFGKKKPNGQKVKVGVTADAVIQGAIANYAGVKEKDIDFVTVGFDATPLISGQVDALAGYWTTQAYELEKANIPYTFLSVSEIPGLKQPSMIAVASVKTLTEKKDQLERWLKATIKGSEFVVSNPEEAAKNILDTRCGGPSFNEAQEAWLIKKSVPLFKKPIGMMDEKMIVDYSLAYKNLDQIPFAPDSNSFLDFSILTGIGISNTDAKTK